MTVAEPELSRCARLGSVGEIAVTPERVRAVGSTLATIGSEVASLEKAPKGLESAAAAAPQQTAASLASLAFEWSAGLERLGDSLASVGQLTVAAGWLYDLVDNRAVPVDETG